MTSPDPPARCRRCPRPAQLVVVARREGREVQVRLCSGCASGLGLLPGVGIGEPGPRLAAQIEKLIDAELGEARARPSDRPCPACGADLDHFRATGRLGCPDDWEAFADELLPALLGTQGASRHVGKVPTRSAHPAELDRARRRRGDRGRLRRAVADEDYEEAARLRDRLRGEAAREPCSEDLS